MSWLGRETKWALVFATLVGASCGGESSSDDPSTGGTSTGGTSTGGTSTGGTSTGGGGMGGAPTGGTGACGPPPGGTDCIDPCSGGFTLPICDNQQWTCPDGPCPDAGGAPSDAPPDVKCSTGEVPTLEGCMTCAAVSQKLAAALEAARKANASCGTAADCVLTTSNTTCSGACGVAVSKAGESAFQAELSKLDLAYCSYFVPECGYSTPKCAQATLECNAGSCEAKYN